MDFRIIIYSDLSFTLVVFLCRHVILRNFMREHITVVLPYANIRVPALY